MKLTLLARADKVSFSLHILIHHLQLFNLLHRYKDRPSGTFSSAKMASLISLPHELFLMIRGYLNSQSAINALAQTCRYFYNLLMDYLYQYNIKYHYCTAIISLSRNCHMRALQELIDQDDRMPKDIQDKWRAWHPAFNNVRLLYLNNTTDKDEEERRIDGSLVPLERNVYCNPLNGPAEAGYDDMVMLLLKAGARPDYSGIFQYTTFVLAAANGHSETAKLLFRAAKTWNIYTRNWDKYRDTPYWEIPYWKRTHRVKPYSDTLSFDPTYWNRDFWKDCLRYACQEGYEDRVRFLFDGIKPLGHYRSFIHPRRCEAILKEAIQKGHTKVAAIILEHIGKELSHLPERKATLEIALRSGNEETVCLLVKNDYCTLSKNSYTPVRMAAKSGNAGILRLLHERGLDLYFRDRYGRTALSYAAERGHKSAVEFLITKDVNIYTKDKRRRSALDWAVKRGRTEIINILKPLYAQQTVKKRKPR